MNRFYVEKSNIGQTSIKITHPLDVRHLAGALRLAVGEDIIISDGQGARYICKAAVVGKNYINLNIVKRLKVQGLKDNIKIVVAVAIPKHSRFEDIADKLTQLGIDEIIPLVTDRTLVKKEVFDVKLERYKKIVISSAKQSSCLFLPIIREAVLFGDFIKRVSGYDLCLLPNLSNNTLSLKKAVSDFKGKSILVIIGPEGDFTEKEIALALSLGCYGVSLGESVLRVDTAAIAVVSFLRLYFEK